MLEWIARGLRKGVVTTRYPRRPEPAPPGFHGLIHVIEAAGAAPGVEDLCPTGAIAVDDGAIRVERARCILCGACVAADPARFRFEAAYETAFPASGTRPLAQRARPLKRSIHIRHVDAGSDGSEEWEIAALTNPYYDMQRLGLFFTAAPRHADILLVTGAVTQAMEAPLRRAWDVMPEPKAIVAAGTDACSGGFSAVTGETAAGVASVLPVDVYVPGSPPTPIALLHGLLLAAGIVTEDAAA
ncbi:MAG TPA: ferredoxin [Gaiellaceae bacterium]|nr:ferredoxin [Gaiellaceae bacterium]